MRTILTVILFFLFMVSSFSQIKFKVKIGKVNNQDNNQKILIKLTFKSKDSTSFYFDYKTICKDCYNYEDFTIKSLKTNDLQAILKNLKFNQIVIENENGDLKFFSTDSYFSNTERDLWSDPCTYGECIKEYILDMESSFCEEFELYKEDLKINEIDKKIRLHYLFKSNYENEKQNISSVIITSNWFKIPASADLQF